MFNPEKRIIRGFGGVWVVFGNYGSVIFPKRSWFVKYMNLQNWKNLLRVYEFHLFIMGVRCNQWKKIKKPEKLSR